MKPTDELAACWGAGVKHVRRCLLAAKHAPRSRRWVRELTVKREPTGLELAEAQWHRTVDLVRHCWAHVPYYRDLFRRIGFHPDELVSQKVFTQLPILEKDDVREHLERMLADRVSPRFRRPVATGGSTGRPLKVYLDTRFPSHLLSSRMLSWWGVDPSDNSGYLYRAIPEGLKKVFTAIGLYPTRRAYLHSADMTLDKMRRFYETLRRLRVSYLVGYVGAVDAFGQFLEAGDLRIPTLKAIWTTAAPLPRFKQRMLDKIYGCPVYTQYGCVEVPFLAAECQCRCGLHVFSDIRRIEVISRSGSHAESNEVGDIVATDLTNYVCPMLRYRVGDRGQLLAAECKCGRPYPLMDYVQGRTSDNIYLPDGGAIPGEYWTTIFDDWPDAIQAFQVRQHADYSVEIRFQPAGSGWKTAVDEVERVLASRTQRQLQITFQQATVDVNDNGKTRYVVSDIHKQQRSDAT